MKQNINFKKLLLVGAFVSLCTNAMAEINVNKSAGMLSITSDISGTVKAKVIGPENEVVVDESYSGSSFSWTPSGADGAYRYDVRVIPEVHNDNDAKAVELAEVVSVATSESYYAGGSVEVRNGQMAMTGEE